MDDSFRCSVDNWDDTHIYATIAGSDRRFVVNVNDTTLLQTGMQLNLLDCVVEGDTITPSLIIIEPDFLLDISAVSACFQSYGHHPANYLLNQLRPRPNSQAILLGNFAGTALDDLINHSHYLFSDTLRRSFREQALQFCTCNDFDAQQFKTDGERQVTNIREAVVILFGGEASSYDASKALLEPSFVCERLGLQGRVDLMTDDMRLLVEQKSGKNWRLEQGLGEPYQEAHYVQLLLYYGVLHYNFHITAKQTDIRLLYSRYPARQGLLPVGYSQQLFREAISLRNNIVAQQIGIARNGFSAYLTQLSPDSLLQRPYQKEFFLRYVNPQVEALLHPFTLLNHHEKDYVERMMTFVYREQLAQKMRMNELQDVAISDLWNMTLDDKVATGSILLGSITSKEADVVTLTIDTIALSPNFRRGDMVYLYRYEEVPDVRASILYKGSIEQLNDSETVIRLKDRQQNPHIFKEGTYAVEHASSDIGIGSAIRSICAFCAASQEKRSLLLGQQAPRRNTALRLSRNYHPHYDEVLLKACQAEDYFLLQGPPGTGKTSMALRFLVEEELTTQSSHLLLTAYTNRAVDEICGMLENSGQDYLRLGNRASCDPCYAHRILDEVLGEKSRLDEIRQKLCLCRIIVATTSTLQARPFLLQLKRFSLCIVDEASQILEPSIIGLLASDSIRRFILIGDHKQLPAVVQQPDDPQLHDCRRSLFERLLRQEQEAGRADFIGLLRRQGRMHPDVAAFPNEHFYQREQLLCTPCPHQEEKYLDYPQPSEDALDDQLKHHRVLFLPSDTTPNAQQSTLPKVNIAEAQIVADLLRRIWRQYGSRFNARQSVGVIVPYRNQIAQIRHAITQLDIPELSDVTIDTVERYQGSQRDVIIYSFTVQHTSQLDFLTTTSYVEPESGQLIDRKLNVVMTRARCQLLMTGNVRVLSQNSLFRELIRRYWSGAKCPIY
ncbi:MAG: DNA2/NAM7 family helicase [Prevotella sp.]|nr:DNA2/NAM7 family helicase [Prevotella sp.]